MQSPPIETVLPAIKELDNELFNNTTESFSPEIIETTAEEIASKHDLNKDVLLQHFTNMLLLSQPASEDNAEFYHKTIEYLSKRV